jgi:hypothetical protein
LEELSRCGASAAGADRLAAGGYRAGPASPKKVAQNSIHRLPKTGEHLEEGGMKCLSKASRKGAMNYGLIALMITVNAPALMWCYSTLTGAANAGAGTALPSVGIGKLGLPIGTPVVIHGIWQENLVPVKKGRKDETEKVLEFLVDSIDGKPLDSRPKFSVVQFSGMLTYLPSISALDRTPRAGSEWTVLAWENAQYLSEPREVTSYLYKKAEAEGFDFPLRGGMASFEMECWLEIYDVHSIRAAP